MMMYVVSFGFKGMMIIDWNWACFWLLYKVT